ncbi:MAG TPA: hypothetical protein VEK57_31675 [Thermoanaerobaculia bacterium]|nr:hypothetical protein [Thermoanaerobaculia bacterium]
MILAALLAVTMTFSPAQPKVGDLIAVEFAAPVKLDASPAYEVVSQEGNRVVVRTFEPKPFALSGTQGGVRFRNLQVPVGSVLQPGDLMQPAPLVPPREVPYPRAPFLAIGIAALIAAIAWAVVWWRSRKPAVVPVEIVPPDERFRRAVLALRRDARHPLRWAVLADETRAFLAATRSISSDLTTTEVVPRLKQEETIVIDILRQGDLEKFSGRGAEPRDFDSIAADALHLASVVQPEERKAS